MKIVKLSLILAIGCVLLTSAPAFSIFNNWIKSGLSEEDIKDLSRKNINDKIDFDNKQWKVIKNEDKTLGQPIIKTLIKLDPSGKEIRKERLILKIVPNVRQITESQRPELYYHYEGTWLHTILVAAFTTIGGAYLAIRFAPDYLNHLIESTPWLNSLKDTFNTQLEKFGFSQSK